MNWVKTALDLAVSALNYFPGLKTKAGAVLQVIGTLMLAYNTTLGGHIPAEVVMWVNAAAATLVAVGAANQPANNTPSA